MSVYYSPRIGTTNGLYLYLDAKDAKSYPGSGDKWYNLAQEKITEAKLINTTYDPTNGGSIVCNGSNSYISIDTGWTISGMTEITVEVVFKSTVAGNSNNGYLIFDSNFTSYPFWLAKTSDNLWYFFWNYGAGVSKSAYISSSSYVANSWIHIAIRGYLSNSTTISETGNFFELIVNGNNYSTGHNNNNTSSLNYPNSVTFIGRRGASFGNGVPPGSPVTNYSSISIGSYKVYNRVLSRSEILANYNSVKLKYNM